MAAWHGGMDVRTHGAWIMESWNHGPWNHGPWAMEALDHGPWTMDRGTLGRGPGYIFTMHGSTAAGGVAAVLGGI